MSQVQACCELFRHLLSVELVTDVPLLDGEYQFIIMYLLLAVLWLLEGINKPLELSCRVCSVDQQPPKQKVRLKYRMISNVTPTLRYTYLVNMNPLTSSYCCSSSCSMRSIWTCLPALQCKIPHCKTRQRFIIKSFPVIWDSLIV